VDVSGHEIRYEEQKKERYCENHQMRKSEGYGEADQKNIADEIRMIFNHSVALVFHLPFETGLTADAIDHVVQLVPYALILFHPIYPFAAEFDKLAKI
jgi:hypothetical protein